MEWGRSRSFHSLCLFCLIIVSLCNALERGDVSLPVVDPTKSFWIDTPGANPLAQVGSKGALTRDGDVCIIGSGITGVSAAWHLSRMLNEGGDSTRRESRVVVLEAREFCSGATGRNGGHLTPNVFASFLSRQATHNTTEALKSYLLEKYTADALVQFIKEKMLESTVDLVEGGHIDIFRTNDAEMAARRDYEAARAAGLGAGGNIGVKWIGTKELHEKYGVDTKHNYTAVAFGGHNLWPCKLVTHLFQDAQSSFSGVDVSLHTRTPVTSISRTASDADGPLDLAVASPLDQIPISTLAHRQGRRWTLHTHRGDIGCTYVVHATNGYAAHLLPFLAGPSDPNLLRSPTPPPRGAYGIVPTRGQVGAVRASVGPSELPWLSSWDGGGDDGDYWFPRYQDTAGMNMSNVSGSNILVSEQKNPLIILGGERHFAGGTLEAGITDDSTLNLLVSKALRAFLPGLFPDQFERVPSEGVDKKDPWEMEWTGIMAFTNTGEPFVGPVVPLANDTSEASLEAADAMKEDYEGQYIAAGYTGHGMPRAYACAEAVAGMIKAQIRNEQWIAPKWLPERYLTWATHA